MTLETSVLALGLWVLHVCVPARLPAEEPVPKAITNSVGMKLALVPAGTFLMGSPGSEPQRQHDEGPQHPVTITKPFYMGIYEVTQREYEAVCGANPAYWHKGNGGSPDHPVERVSWQDATEFCRKLSALPDEKKAGRVYRLPTEAEWEYACRAGTSSAFHFGNALSSKEANFNGNYPYGGASKGPNVDKTCKAGSFPSNALGLYDMHGNLSEWCADWYDHDYYKTSPKQDPQGPATGQYRVLRGGSWLGCGWDCRTAARDRDLPDHRYGPNSFRVVLVPSAGKP